MFHVKQSKQGNHVFHVKHVRYAMFVALGMTNDEIPNDEGMTNDEIPNDEKMTNCEARMTILSVVLATS